MSESTSTADRVRTLLAEDRYTTAEIAARAGCVPTYVRSVRSRLNAPRQRTARVRPRLLTRQIAWLAAEESGFTLAEVLGRTGIDKARTPAAARCEARPEARSEVGDPASWTPAGGQPSRYQRLRKVRALVMFLAWGEGKVGRTSSAIAKAMGRADHSSVLWAVRGVRGELARDAGLQALRERIEARMAAWVPPPPVMVFAPPPAPAPSPSPRAQDPLLAALRAAHPEMASPAPCGAGSGAGEGA